MKEKRALLYIILAGILWGTSVIFVHCLAPMGFTSIQMTAVRAIVSLLCLLVYACFWAKKCFCIKPIHLILCAGIGISLFFTSSCYYLSMQMTSASTSIVLLYTAPVYIFVISVMFLHERVSKVKCAAIACMLIGCFLMSGVIGGGNWNFKGVLLGILAGVAYAVYNILTKIAMKQKLEPISITLYGFGFMSLISIFSMDSVNFVASVVLDPMHSIPLLVGLGVCTFVIPFFLYTVAVGILPVGTCSALSIMEPMSATIFSVLLFHERLELFSIFGIGLILFATVLIGKQAERET